MKVSRLMLVTLTMALLAAGAYQTHAFHAGGVAECVGCHSMHDAASGALLTMNDTSSTCLNCHENSSGSSYHVSTAEGSLAPGTPPGAMTAPETITNNCLNGIITVSLFLRGMSWDMS